MRKFATRSDFASYLKSESFRQKVEEQEEIHYEPPPHVNLSTHTQEKENEHAEGDTEEPIRQLDYCHANQHWKLEYEDGEPLSRHERLSKSTNYRLERIARVIKPPKIVLPSICMPRWKVEPLNNKLPLLRGPPDAVYFCRGKIGQEVGVRKKTGYITEDQYNQRKLIITPYNALHDPHSQQYFEKPEMKKILEEQGLVNAEGEVLCSVRQYNAYRRFMSEQYNEKILGYLAADAERARVQAAQHEELNKFKKALKDEVVTSKKMTKHIQAKQRRKLLKQNRLLLLRARDFDRQLKDEEREVRLHKVDTVKIYMNQLVNEYRYAVYQKAKLKGWNERARTMMRFAKTDKFIEKRIEYDRVVQREVTYLKNYERFKRRFDESKNKQKFISDVQVQLSNNLESASKRRQGRYEVRRGQIKERIIEELKRKQRLKLTVRNYFHEWLEKARYKLGRRPDSVHVSTFPIQKSVENYTRLILSQFDSVQRKQDFKLARAKLLRTMDAHGNIILEEDEGEVKRRVSHVLPKEHRINVHQMASMMLREKHNNPDDVDWRERWREAHKIEEDVRKLSEEQERSKLAKDQASERYFLSENVKNLEKLESKNRKKKQTETKQERKRSRQEQALRRRNTIMAEHYRDNKNFEAPSETDFESFDRMSSKPGKNRRKSSD